MTAREIRTWAAEVDRRQNCVNTTELHEGDWRDRFARGLALSGDLALLSFDPYMFDRHGPGRRPRKGNMYPDDLDILKHATGHLNQSVIVQLSTYSANNNNPQDAVIGVLKSRLQSRRFEIVADVRADGNMMSVVLARGVNWASSLKSIPSRFESWLSEVRKRRGHA